MFLWVPFVGLFGFGHLMAQDQLYKGKINIRILREVEAHWVGYGRRDRDQPAFDPVPSNSNTDSIVAVISKELDKYPLAVLITKAELGEIVLCDGVYFNDSNGEPTIRMNGTYLGPTDIGNVLFLDAAANGLPKTLHHEMSSLLFNVMYDIDSVFRLKYRQTERLFRASTSYYVDSPEYLKDPWGFPKNKDNRIVLRNDGYAQTDFENDYNSIAASLFASKNVQAIGEQLVGNEREFWNFLLDPKTKAEPIYFKVMQIVELYSYVDPSFTLEYFKKVGRR